MLRVSPGDTVNASVYGKYADKTDNTEHVVDNIFTLLATAFGLNAATSEAGLTANGMENALAGQAAITPDGNAPKAYLNYIFLDKNFDSGNTTSGFERLPSGALNNYQLLAKEIPIKAEGFLYIYVANESPYDQGVWFDDFTVEVIKSPVSALSDYYPFGMLQAGNSTNSGDPVGNKYLYQGKEWQNELGLDIYDFHARMYDPIIGRTFQLDPMAEKYYSLSAYSWVANNPLIFTDPTGMEIDWSEISGKEKRVAKRALRKHNNSGTYKNLYKQLKKSENRYVIKSSYDENTTTGASFEGNFSTTLEGPDGDKVTFQNPGTEGDFGSDEKGGVITLNFSMVDGLENKDQASILGDFAVEEVVHAAQYDNLNQDGAIGLPGTANTEFEAKAIVGQIQFESKRPLWTSTDDGIANTFGVNAFKTGSTTGYQNALKKWHNNLKPSSAYKKRRITNAAPTLLKRLVNKKR